MPSSSIASCAGVSDTLPSFAAGQTNRPRSSRFTNRQAAWPSHQITFTRSPHEEMPGERVLLQRRLGLRRQRREAPAHVRHPGRQPDLRGARDRDHPDSPRSSRASASGSYPPLIRIRWPPATSISIRPPGSRTSAADEPPSLWTPSTISTGRKQRSVARAAPGSGATCARPASPARRAEGAPFRHRRPNHPARGLRPLAEAAQEDRGALRLGQDRRRHGPSRPSRPRPRQRPLHPHHGGLQPRSLAEAARHMSTAPLRPTPSNST